MFMNKSSKLVCGIGTKGLTYSTTDNSDNMECSRIYQLWLNMLKRCTAKFQTEYPTYVGTTCSENFKSYTFFTEWCYVQAGFTTESVGGCWQLDKDTLIKGNKLYGEDTCVFVPRRVNMLLVKRDAKRGKHKKFKPKVFTEYGVIMAASVLRSKNATRMNIAIIRSFIALRQYAIEHKELHKLILEMEKKYDFKFNSIEQVINYL